MGELDGRVVLITGASRGLGRAMAHAFAAAGANLVLTGRRAPDLAAVAEALRPLGRSVQPIAADLRSEADVRRLAATALDRSGRIDVLVNNAGVGVVGAAGSARSIFDISLADWDNVFSTNVRGPFLLSLLVLPGMLERADGVIINMTSGLVETPRPGLAAYGGSKAALDYLTRSLAPEVDPLGVRVYGLHPGGPVETDFFGQHFPEVFRARGLKAEVIALPAVYLAAERPAHLSGTVLNAVSFHQERGLSIPWLVPRA